MTFTVLFVCTGNICRSPMAERLFRARVGDAAGVLAVSAGTSGVVGYPMDLPSAIVLRELGGDPTGHLARRLETADIDDADLVLTADSAHRSAVLGLQPLAFRRAFTMREFAHLGAGLPSDAPVGPGADALRERVRTVGRRRGESAPMGAGQENIGDPFGATPAVVRMTGQQVSAAVDGIIAALGLTPAVPDGA